MHDAMQLTHQSKSTHGHHMRCIPPLLSPITLPGSLLLTYKSITSLLFPSVILILLFRIQIPLMRKRCNICLIYLNMMISSSSTFLYGHHLLTLFPLNTFPYLAITIFPEQLIFMSLSSLKKSSVRAQLTYTRSPC